MIIVIVDSGVVERYSCKCINFPISTNIPSIKSGHGTAIFNIINTKCSSFAEIINFRIIDIERHVEEKILIDALEYIDKYIHPDIINLSLGISKCSNLSLLYESCLKLTQKGIIIISAFDNTGSISYPAAFPNVIGVISGAHCSRIDDFEFFDDSMVNIGAKGNIQRLAWDNPSYVFLSGNSFACAHVTAKVAEMFFISGKKLSLKDVLNNFRKISLKIHSILSVTKKSKNIPFRIHNASIFPFSKEMHSLLRYEFLLDFKISDIYDTKYSSKVGTTTSHLMNDVSINSYVIKNIDKINYENFDTIILGHINELSFALKNDKYIGNFIDKIIQKGKNIFSFDDLTYYGYSVCDNVYFPSIDEEDLQPNRFGMLYRISKPVLGVFGTSSRQGKFTLQLKLRQLLLNAGYNVGQIGTEPSALLYGMDYVFPMGHNSSVYIKEYDVIRYLNYIINDLCIKNKDIILVGSQSGTIPYDIGNLAQFNISQYNFLIGTQPDAVVLCVNPYDNFDYIERTINFIESSVDCKVISLVVFPMDLHENWLGNNSMKISLSYEKYEDIKKSLYEKFNIPVFKLGTENEMIKLTQTVIVNTSRNPEHCGRVS